MRALVARQKHRVVQSSVDPEANHHAAALWLEVNVRRPLADRVQENGVGHLRGRVVAAAHHRHFLERGGQGLRQMGPKRTR